jgi:hypothetical protein
MNEGEPYREPGKDGDRKHCRNCGDEILFGGKRCVRCGVNARKVWRERRHTAFVLSVVFLGWVAITAFTTLTGYLLDMTDGEPSWGAEVAGTVGFVAGGILFGIAVWARVGWLSDE